MAARQRADLRRAVADIACEFEIASIEVWLSAPTPSSDSRMLTAVSLRFAWFRGASEEMYRVVTYMPIRRQRSCSAACARHQISMGESVVCCR